MKFDITRLPVAEAVVGFLLLALALTFVGAFIATDNDGGDAAASPTSSATATPDGTPGDGETIAMSMGDNFFDPEEVTASPGSTVTFDITNDGGSIHNMRVAGADGDYDSEDDAVSDSDAIRAGQTGALTWQVPGDAAEIDFRCDFHPAVMTGVITVQ